jgi:hypothetical protein
MEGVDDVAHRLGITAQAARNRRGVPAAGTGQQNLATAEDERVRRTQTILQGLLLVRPLTDGPTLVLAYRTPHTMADELF